VPISIKPKAGGAVCMAGRIEHRARPAGGDMRCGWFQGWMCATSTRLRPVGVPMRNAS
jgi:hypothetical protein